MRDDLFLAFACAFFRPGPGQPSFSPEAAPSEARGLLRLAAFGLILGAIVRKNRSRA